MSEPRSVGKCSKLLSEGPDKVQIRLSRNGRRYYRELDRLKRHRSPQKFRKVSVFQYSHKSIKYGLKFMYFQESETFYRKNEDELSSEFEL